MSRSHAQARAEEVARVSYGKLVAMMAARTGDIMAAEDALADAFQRALEIWPERGIPDRPEAWLMTTAKNKAIDAARKMSRIDLRDEVPEMADPAMTEESAFPDERLSLMFVCAHPAIDDSLHTPLMLQTVLGLEAEDIGRAFLVPGKTMAQRLVRAKRKIKAARIPFVVPDRSEIAPRMSAVLEAVYGAFGADWLADEQPLADEALYLARVLVDVVPEDTEALGLLALLTFIHARRDARVKDGVLVPLPEQDCDLWDNDLNLQADAILQRASSMKQLGRFQLEAAIQAVHASRAVTGRTDWRALTQLYAGLRGIAPTVGAAVAEAAAVAEDAGPAAGLACLERIDPAALKVSQPGWAVRAHLLSRLGRLEEADAAYARAIALAVDLPLRRWLERKRGENKLSLH